MKKEWLLAAATTLVTLGGALLLVRALAPQLLGIPIDLQMVSVSEEVPPFFENVFRREDLQSPDYLIKDPLAGVRATPLFPDQVAMGPNDLLGFRNRAVPNVADVVVIGDSQTYGNNSSLENNWPGRMAANLSREKDATLYNMSVGGWGAVQYLYAAVNAPVFRPRVLVVAFYSGNDPLESFRLAYNYPAWGELIPDGSLSADDVPRVTFPDGAEGTWPVEFGDELRTTFTPEVRLASNGDHPAARAGWAIMADVARRIAQLAAARKTPLVFTIIPTKELVYAQRLAQAELQAPAAYRDLVHAESRNIAQLRAAIEGIGSAYYVDVVGPLQEAALGDTPLYPDNDNGHPVDAGYKVIAATMTGRVWPLLPDPMRGLALMRAGDKQYEAVLLETEGYWLFPDSALIEANGWVIENAPVVDRRVIAGERYAGHVMEVDPARFGPAAFVD